MGEVFGGRFELLDPIAEGGMGSVWRVRDHRDGEVYAGKVLRQSDAGSLLRFMREQTTRVIHPHVVTPLSWAGEDDRVLFTMPLVDGGSVATLLGDHGPLLTDFGLAAPVDQPRMTRASQVLGTPGYLAPEQLQGADPDPAQDVYAVGVVGLEMVTGRRPRPGGPLLAEELPAGTRDLCDLLLTACSPDPAHRPAGAATFRARLHDLRLPPPEGGPEAPYVFDQVGHRAATPADPPARSRADPPAESRAGPPPTHGSSTPDRAGRPTGTGWSPCCCWRSPWLRWWRRACR